MGKITAGAGSTKKAELLRSNYRIARLGLLIATVLSALNCIFAFFEGVFYFYSEFSYCLTNPIPLVDFLISSVALLIVLRLPYLVHLSLSL